MTFERHVTNEDIMDMDQHMCRACTKTFDLLLYACLLSNKPSVDQIIFAAIYLAFYLQIFCFS